MDAGAFFNGNLLNSEAIAKSCTFKGQLEHAQVVMLQDILG